MVAYEDRLRREPRWALAEGSRHFEDRSAVHDTLRRAAARLDALGIPYALVGGMALFHHGYRRFTEDIDLLVTREGLRRIQEHMEGLGYVRATPTGRTLRDAESGVRVEFLVAGDFPGDGRPKAVAFPDPASAATERDGLRVINLHQLVELKLASGMSHPGRLRDLSDVLELIRLLGLNREFADRLDPSVRAKFAELHAAATSEPDAH